MEWTLAAKCRGMGDALFPEPVEQARASQVCNGCPVRAECLAEALDNRIEFGIWGGTTERQRRALLRRRPYVTSWKSVLCSDRTGETGPDGSRRARVPDAPARVQALVGAH